MSARLYSGVLVALACGVLLTGCASIINGRSQSVDFESTPTGADLTVGGLKATTPAKLTLTRKETYTATFTKADFPDRTIQLEPRASWWLAGNLLVGGLIGIIIDLATGSGMTLSPSDVHMDLATGRVERVKEPDSVRSVAQWGERECRRLHNAGLSSKYRDHCVGMPGYEAYR